MCSHISHVYSLYINQSNFHSKSVHPCTAMWLHLLESILWVYMSYICVCFTATCSYLRIPLLRSPIFNTIILSNLPKIALQSTEHRVLFFIWFHFYLFMIFWGMIVKLLKSCLSKIFFFSRPHYISFTFFGGFRHNLIDVNMHLTWFVFSLWYRLFLSCDSANYVICRKIKNNTILHYHKTCTSWYIMFINLGFLDDIRKKLVKTFLKHHEMEKRWFAWFEW